MNRTRRSKNFYILASFFGVFVIFLYGPMLTIVTLSFQGPQGGLTFPMNGISTFWFERLWHGVGVIDIWRGFRRSIYLGLVVMALTVIFSLLAGLAFRKGFFGESTLFFVVVSSLIMPSIVVSLGIGLGFQMLDDYLIALGENYNFSILSNFETSTGLYTSALGAHLTWTLPFGLLIMFAIFNRFNPAHEEAAKDLGANNWKTIWYVVIPIIAPSLIGIALFGFTLSYDELARTQQAAGSENTLPLDLQGLTTTVTTPEIYALGTVTLAVSFAIILMTLFFVMFILKKRSSHATIQEKV